MNLFRATIPDDRGRPVQLLALCIRAKWLQRGDGKLKYDLETPIRWNPKAWLVMLLLAPVLVLIMLVVHMALFEPTGARGSSLSLRIILQGTLLPWSVLIIVLPLHAALTARWLSAEIRNASLFFSSCSRHCLAASPGHTCAMRRRRS